jgi:cadmium resistance protein CadD (predicted permease)
MQFGKSVGIACSSFAITNIDDMFVLVTFFSEASTSKTMTPLRITLGQYIGFTVIIIISMIGFGISLALPFEPIGFLGLLPILMGVWKLFGLLLSEEEEEPEMPNSAGIKSILKVSAITVMNGGDNIGTYVPLFSQAKGAEIAVYVVIYYILLGVWCLAALLVMRQKHVLRLTQKYMRWVIPFLFLGLGMYIIIKSSCYPWSIQHIDASASTHPGKIIMAVVTTVLLLICMGIMLWLKLRKKTAQPLLDGDVPLEGNLPRSPESTIGAQTCPPNASCHSHISTSRVSKEIPNMEDIDLPTGAAQLSPAPTSSRITNNTAANVKGEGELPEIKMQGAASTPLLSDKVENK